ncbi:MAG: SMC family ATPase [Acidimicrobiaceae bacterium]|nr:SMC family ATPase [Acidimicrobiaceae bacterium]
MRPLRLEMKGFGAFREETVVDFGDVELAAFVGATGSGKSTIIDGITFALFGVVTRYDDRRAVAPAINQMVSEARVLFEFEVDSERYTAVRVARRTANGATTKEARLEHGDEVLAGRAGEMEQAVEQILGLDFDRFTKTVVLPQGRFAAFLHDKPKDRQDLLRQLLDLGVYERMGVQARQRAKTARVRLEELEPQLAAEVPSEEQLAVLAEALGAVTEAQTELDGLLNELDQRNEAVVAACEEAEGLGVLLLAATGVTVPEPVEKLGDDLKQAQHAAASAASARAEAARKARGAEQAEKEGPNMEACRLLLGQQGDLADLTQKLAKLDEECDIAETRHREAAERADEIRNRLELAKAAVTEAGTAADAAQKAADEGPDSAKLGRWREQRSELTRLNERLETANETLTTEQEHEAEARDAFEQARGDLHRVGERLDQARAIKQAEGLVAQLVEGEPCPVCRQPVHELPDHDLDAELVELQRVHAEAETLKREHEEVLDKARTALANAEAAVESAAKRCAELSEALADASDDTELDRLTALADDYAEAVTATQAKLDATRQAETDLRDGDETKKALRAEQEAQVHLTRTTTQRDAIRSERDQLAERLADEPDEEALHADIARAEQLAETCQEARNAETEAQEAEQTAVKVREELTEAELQARQEFAKTRDGFAALKPPTPEASLIEDWRALVAWAAELAAALPGELDKANDQVTTAETQWTQHAETARAVCTPHFDPGDDPKRWRTEMATAAERAKGDHQRASDQRLKMADLETRVEGLRTEERVASELGRLLRTDRFEKWLLEDAIGDLMTRAGERLLQLSNGQYSFDADGAEFDICDHHNADQIRAAKTLSGGETFLASLALALALSDSHAEMAPEGAPGLDSLFLDEGFGTLDPETLDVTAAAIEELGASGRMVAIVTHIRELAERMPIRFEVAKSPTTSTVTRVTV